MSPSSGYTSPDINFVVDSPDIELKVTLENVPDAFVKKVSVEWNRYTFLLFYFESLRDCLFDL